MAKKKVLFLCTGNSCRSQMAEGFARRLGGELMEVCSAGIAPVGINPRAVQVMEEVGVDITGQSSTAFVPEMLQNVDLVITLCGDARESCPAVPGRVEKRHWSLPDPARAEGSSAEVLAAFRSVRDAVKKYVEELVAELG
ncbi:MAG: arsenate reductase ArsC [Bacillota bacterium]